MYDADAYLRAAYGPDYDDIADECPACCGGRGSLCVRCAAEVSRDFALMDLERAQWILARVPAESFIDCPF